MRFLLRGNESVLKLGSDESSTALWTYYKTLSSTLLKSDFSKTAVLEGEKQCMLSIYMWSIVGTRKCP